MEPDQMNRPQSTIAKITNFFSGGNSNTSKTLLKWKISSEQEEWTNKAVDTLVKKLKKQPNGIKNIHEVLKSKSDTSICVTIPRSIDGRLQVNFMYKLRFDELDTEYQLDYFYQCAAKMTCCLKFKFIQNIFVISLFQFTIPF